MVQSLISESCKFQGLVSLEDSWMKISVVVVEEFGLTTCGRGVVDQRVRLLIRGSAQGFCSEPIHMEDEVKDLKDEVEDERDCEL